MENQPETTVGERIRLAREEQKMSQTELARKTGLSQAQISAYETNQYHAKMDKLLLIAKAMRINPCDLDPDLQKKLEVLPAADEETLRRYPVISEAAAATCNTTYFPMADWASEQSDEYCMFNKGKPGDFVIRVTGDSMLPLYPAGTLILVRPNVRILNNNRVVAFLQDGSVVFKVFREEKDCIRLLSINGCSGREYRFDKTDYTSVRAIVKVVQSMINEDDVDSAMNCMHEKRYWEYGK